MTMAEQVNKIRRAESGPLARVGSIPMGLSTQLDAKRESHVHQERGERWYGLGRSVDLPGESA